MGHSLCEHSQTARDIYRRADDILGWSVSDVSFQGPESLLTETRVCQPALYVVGYVIFQILKERSRLGSLGAALGLSLGEITAFAVAGVVDFESGLELVAERGRLMQSACGNEEGAMASIIGGTRREVEALCSEFDVDMANLNGPGQIVISGHRQNITEAVAVAKQNGRFRTAVMLNVAGAYHSRLMQTARDEFEQFLSSVQMQRPQIPVFSNTTGCPIWDPGEIKVALTRQLVSPVLWEDCMRNAASSGIGQFYECGPKGVLSGLGRRTDSSWKFTRLEQFEDLPR